MEKRIQKNDESPSTIPNWNTIKGKTQRAAFQWINECRDGRSGRKKVIELILQHVVSHHFIIFSEWVMNVPDSEASKAL